MEREREGQIERKRENTDREKHRERKTAVGKIKD
jgi:hypothetical protein